MLVIVTMVVITTVTIVTMVVITTVTIVTVVVITIYQVPVFLNGISVFGCAYEATIYFAGLISALSSFHTSPYNAKFLMKCNLQFHPWQ